MLIGQIVQEPEAEDRPTVPALLIDHYSFAQMPLLYMPVLYVTALFHYAVAYFVSTLWSTSYGQCDVLLRCNRLPSVSAATSLCSAYHAQTRWLLSALSAGPARRSATLIRSETTPMAVTSAPAPGPWIRRGRFAYRFVVKEMILSAPASAVAKACVAGYLQQGVRGHVRMKPLIHQPCRTLTFPSLP